MRIIATTIAILFAAASSAFAHAHLDHASPAVGSTVTQSPKEIMLWFTNELEPAFSSIEVRNDKGESVQTGKASVDRANRTQLRVPLKSLRPGNYKVIWRVLSVDTHRTEGNFTFRVGP
jgi:copper resistance protein C